ncbi:phosphatidylinositol-specific phospholipase C1-like protein [Saccharicrinis sp. 156]|uniref:phosphatidylinositol-specific phospholipase C1-like protein n=1 Tax=Saccharicrinis sp. 156 TaxID=3417574 RepID=UPI003D330125
MKKQVLLITFIITLSMLSCCKPKTGLNDVQVIGSHNSYKIAIEKPVWDYLFQMDSAKAISLQYAHIPILEQLNLGLRNVELDVFFDPNGGHFSNPKGLDVIRANGDTPLAYDEENKLSEPGLKMFHIQDVDFRSHHLLFKDCLKVMKRWSDKNRNHTPVFVLMNTKDQKVEGTRDPLHFTKEAFDSLDQEIRSVFADEDLITPDFVRGDYESLEEAVLTLGWPDLEEVKGRFLFVLDENEEKIDRYLKGHAGLKGRVLFVNSPEGNPEAAFRIINNPIRDFDYIKSLVEKGYLVRTRADAATKESRTLDYTRFEKAKESGAQVISTDYYIPSTLYNSSFKVVFEDNTYERIKK